MRIWILMLWFKGLSRGVLEWLTSTGTVASPQTSFGVRSSRIHFSPTEKWMTNERQRASVGWLPELMRAPFYYILTLPNPYCFVFLLLSSRTAQRCKRTTAEFWKMSTSGFTCVAQNRLCFNCLQRSLPTDYPANTKDSLVRSRQC